MSETKSSTIGHALVAMYGNLRTEFRLGFNGEFVFGDFNPSADFDPVDSDPKRFAAAFRARYGVDRLGTVGEWLNGKNFYPDVIEFLLYHPDNPLDLTPEAIRSLTTPPINGTREWMVARQDCCCVMVAGIPSMEALEMLAKALGYGAAPPAAQPSQAVTYGLTYVLTPLAPVEQRAGEIANLVEDAWNRDAPSWVRQIIPGSFVGNLAESVALIAIPIWRLAQERIAQRTAEILREGGK